MLGYRADDCRMTRDEGEPINLPCSSQISGLTLAALPVIFSRTAVFPAFRLPTINT